MSAFNGTIFAVGKSTTGIIYSEEVLIEAAEKFNRDYLHLGVLGQITREYPPPISLKSHKHICITLNSVVYENGKLIGEMDILNNVVGGQLINLLKNVPEKLKILPIVHGEIDDGVAKTLIIDRVDIHYDNKN